MNLLARSEAAGTPGPQERDFGGLLPALSVAFGRKPAASFLFNSRANAKRQPGKIQNPEGQNHQTKCPCRSILAPELVPTGQTLTFTLEWAPPGVRLQAGIRMRGSDP